MKTDLTKGLHLTVGHDGLVSLWDDETTARKTPNDPSDTYLCLSLTAAQRQDLDQARHRAKRTKLDVEPTPKIGQPINLDGYQRLAQLDGITEDHDSVAILCNNSTHLLVATQTPGGPEIWILRRSLSYQHTAIEVVYAEMLRWALRRAGAVLDRDDE